MNIRCLYMLYKGTMVVKTLYNLCLHIGPDFLCGHDKGCADSAAEEDVNASKQNKHHQYGRPVAL